MTEDTSREEAPKDEDLEYVAVTEPDKAKLADFILRARGPRTMNEFAGACGIVSASSFSRILHGKLTKPLSKELIDAIYKNASPMSNIYYKSLMRANGMIPKESRILDKDNYSRDGRNWYLEDQKLDYRVRNIVADQFFLRGKEIRYIPGINSDLKEKSYFNIRLRGDFAFQVGTSDEEQSFYWNFILYLSTFSGRNLMEEVKKEYRIRGIFGDYSEIFLRDIWEPETMQDAKNTFVFRDPFVFEVFDRMIVEKDLKVNTDMSYILIDVDEGRLIREKAIPRNDGIVTPSIFDLEIQPDTVKNDPDDDMFSEADDPFLI